MSFLRLVSLFILLTFSHAIPRMTSSPGTPLQSLTTKHSLSVTALTALTTAPITTDYRTMPPGTYTVTKTDGSVLIIIVTAVEKTTTITYPSESASPSPLPPCPDECDCSWIKDKESEEYFQCITNPNCRFCQPRRSFIV